MNVSLVRVPDFRAEIRTRDRYRFCKGYGTAEIDPHRGVESCAPRFIFRKKSASLCSLAQTTFLVIICLKAFSGI